MLGPIVLWPHKYHVEDDHPVLQHFQEALDEPSLRMVLSFDTGRWFMVDLKNEMSGVAIELPVSADSPWGFNESHLRTLNYIGSGDHKRRIREIGDRDSRALKHAIDDKQDRARERTSRIKYLRDNCNGFNPTWETIL